VILTRVTTDKFVCRRFVPKSIRPVLEMAFLATYKRQRTMLERQKRLNFLPVMQFKVTTETTLAGVLIKCGMRKIKCVMEYAECM